MKEKYKILRRKAAEHIAKFSQKALKLEKRLGKEFVRISKKGKAHLDFTALHLKKEHLIYLIGREYINSNFVSYHSKHTKKLIEEYKKVSKELKFLEKNLREKS